MTGLRYSRIGIDARGAIDAVPGVSGRADPARIGMGVAITLLAGKP